MSTDYDPWTAYPLDEFTLFTAQPETLPVGMLNRVVKGLRELLYLEKVTRPHMLKLRVMYWLRTRFGNDVATSRVERPARVLEEAAELAQAEGVSRDMVDRTIGRVFARPTGQPAQEAAGVAVTMLAWSAAAGVDLEAATLAEVERIERLPIEHFRRKHAEKADAGTALAGIPPEVP